MQMIDENSLVHVSDIYLAATLQSLGHPMISIDRANPDRSDFLFDNSRRLQEIIGAYWRQELSCEPQGLFVGLKIIRNRLLGER